MSDVIEIPLTKGHVAIIDKVDEALAAFRWHALEDSNGRVYAQRNIRKPDGRRSTVYLHREIMGNACAGMRVDHADGNGLNNRRGNLRATTPKINGQNRSGAKKDSSSGILGVSWRARDNRWRAHIKVDGRNIHLGHFLAVEDAVSARLAAEAKFWGIQPRRSDAHQAARAYARTVEKTSA